MTDPTTPVQPIQGAQEPSQDPIVPIEEPGQGTTEIQSLVEAAVAKAVEGHKGELAGLNQAVSKATKEKDELEKKLKASELEKLSEKERAEAELKEALEKKAAVERETDILKRSRIIDKALIDAGLPVEFAKRITGESDAEILEDVKALNDYVAKHIKDGIDAGITERLGGKPPGSGKAPEAGSFEKSYADAKAAGNTAAMFRIKGQAAAEGVIL